VILGNVLNLDYLRSGRLVAQSKASSAQENRPKESNVALPNTKLEQFSTQTLKAVQDALNNGTVTSDFKIARNPPVSIVNMDFLRSGGEFRLPRELLPAEMGTRDRSSSMNERLQKFYEQTQAAVEKAVKIDAVSSDFKHAKCAPKTIVNTDFLRSGQEFKSNLPVVDMSTRERTSSMNERLQKYYERTQAAVAAAVQMDAVTPDFKHAKCEPKTIVNLDFLRSGGEFSPVLSRKAGPEAETRKRTHSMNERLQQYHDATSSAVTRAIELGQVTPDFKIARSDPASIVNVGFLCSGAEFSPKMQPRMSHGDDTARRSQPMSASRLESFHTRTAAAAAAAAKAGAVPKAK